MFDQNYFARNSNKEILILKANRQMGDVYEITTQLQPVLRLSLRYFWEKTVKLTFDDLDPQIFSLKGSSIRTKI